MALGAGSVTPLQMASAYGAFANGGFGIKPYLIDRVYDKEGRLLMQASPQKAGGNAPRVIDSRNAWLMTTMMQDVVRYGTAARAGQLGRSDLAGKTGTTNDARDTWFAGYNPDLVAISWMGYDQPRSLGRGETGAQSALPVWMDFMAVALRGAPQKGWAMPGGIVTVKIDPGTGARLSDATTEDALSEDAPPGMVEHFYQEFPPREAPPALFDMAPDESGSVPPAPTLPGIPL
jgi:penicillin-binding protein 1A